MMISFQRGKNKQNFSGGKNHQNKSRFHQTSH
jgi:hypothetical protein